MRSLRRPSRETYVNSHNGGGGLISLLTKTGATSVPTAMTPRALGPQKVLMVVKVRMAPKVVKGMTEKKGPRE
jgi:hypothetical protein